ncbi:unnamed protein product [Rhizophagus irregularis]|nr:unnamed protein product [Rhizophagus irregularis]
MRPKHIQSTRRIIKVEGLKEIHQKQMVHRDFHILINDDQSWISHHNRNYRLSTDLKIPTSVYISDMGLCGEASNADKTKIYGVMPYMAPEVLRRRPFTQAADIYSFDDEKNDPVDRINDEEFKEAERYLFKEYKEDDKLITHPQAIYTSRLLDPYTEGLAIDFTESNNEK